MARHGFRVKVWPSSGTLGHERRRFPRQVVDAGSEIWWGGSAKPCRLLDLSRGGARVNLPDSEPDPGTLVRIVVPNDGVRDATVVFRGGTVVGLRFSDQSAFA